MLAYICILLYIAIQFPCMDVLIRVSPGKVQHFSHAHLDNANRKWRKHLRSLRKCKNWPVSDVCCVTVHLWIMNADWRWHFWIRTLPICQLALCAQCTWLLSKCYSFAPGTGGTNLENSGICICSKYVIGRYTHTHTHHFSPSNSE